MVLDRFLLGLSMTKLHRAKVSFSSAPRRMINPAVPARLPKNIFLVPVRNGFDPELETLNHAGVGKSQVILRRAGG